MPVALEKRGEGAQVDVCWDSCGGIGRKCAFYNGFAGSCPRQVICQHVNAEFMV